MSVYRRGGQFYADYYADGKRIRKKIEAADQKEAKKKFRQLVKSEQRKITREKEKREKNGEMQRKDIMSLTPGRAPSTPGVFLKVPIEDFLIRFNNYTAVERAKETQYRYKIAMRYLQDIQPIKYLQDITPTVLENYKRQLLKQGKNAENINRLLQALKTMMRIAERWKLIEKQDWALVKRLKQKKGRVVFHTENELQAMLKAVPAWYRLIIKLGARAGLRRGEMAELRWEDIDFEHNQIYVRANKTENYRYVPISADLKEELEQTPRSKDGFVVSPIGDCSRSSKYFITAAYSKLMKSIGFKSFVHKLRHTFASHLVQKGVELYTVSKMMGHSSIEMTEIYAHLAPQTLQEAIKMIP
jgi:integrase